MAFILTIFFINVVHFFFIILQSMPINCCEEKTHYSKNSTIFIVGCIFNYQGKWGLNEAIHL